MNPADLLAAQPAPHIDYAALSPMIVVFAAAVVGVLMEAFSPHRGRFTAQAVLSGTGLVGAFAAVIVLAMRGTGRTVMAGSVTVDGAALFLQGTILVVGFLSLMLFADRRLTVHRPVREGAAAGAGAPFFAPQASAVPGGADEALARRAGIVQSEIFPLAMFSVGGMMLFPASADLITMFIALEVLSLPLYLLCGLARHRRLISQEAALKYFLLGAYSSAFFIFGAALLYGYAGTVSLDGIAEAARASVEADGPGGTTVLALVGAGLLGMGLLFKVGAVPFHSWIPDVYQGAPTPVTAFMASATKIAAFGALLRVFVVALPALHDQWRPVLWAVAIATMVYGSIVALTQTDIKRMLAYSSVSHIGFMLTAVVPASGDGLSAVLFYLAAYGVSAVGAFALAGLVRSAAADGSGDGVAPEEPDTAQWAGLGRRHPVFGSALALLLLAFAGIPLTSGFVAKFVVFSAALGGGETALVIVGVVCSAIAAFFYIRVIVLMFFADPDGDTPVVAAPGALTAVAVAVSVVVTIVLGVAPQPLLDLADKAAPFLH
ncbi:NADH-quinone oxidoreductase subunit NuoN [Tomitella cavernea]|uniref:NADH-quinone oxidoreductase subunit N n=1 Tax=Tomitella cavernea TaxID=1387982 RepID=A0ABP9CK21_9ACTN|nr:NADH-quinone oxidoreductase subunit NuoN [Tomitella cavernea]